MVLFLPPTQTPSLSLSLSLGETRTFRDARARGIVVPGLPPTTVVICISFSPRNSAVSSPLGTIESSKDSHGSWLSRTLIDRPRSTPSQPKSPTPTELQIAACRWTSFQASCSNESSKTTARPSRLTPLTREIAFAFRDTKRDSERASFFSREEICARLRAVRASRRRCAVGSARRARPAAGDTAASSPWDRSAPRCATPEPRPARAGNTFAARARETTCKGSGPETYVRQTISTMRALVARYEYTMTSSPSLLSSKRARRRVPVVSKK